MSKKSKEMYYRREIKPVKESPFVPELANAIQTRSKSTTALDGGLWNISDARTGEIVEKELPVLGMRKQVDKAMFVKMYKAGIREIFGAPSTALGVLGVLFDAYRDDRENYTDTVLMSYSMAQMEHGYEYTRTTFIKGMNYLIAKRYVAPSVRPNVYFINPLFFFKGDRLTLVRQYDQKQREKLVNGESK